MLQATTSSEQLGETTRMMGTSQRKVTSKGSMTRLLNNLSSLQMKPIMIWKLITTIKLQSIIVVLRKKDPFTHHLRRGKRIHLLREINPSSVRLNRRKMNLIILKTTIILTQKKERRLLDSMIQASINTMVRLIQLS